MKSWPPPATAAGGKADRQRDSATARSIARSAAAPIQPASSAVRSRRSRATSSCTCSSSSSAAASSNSPGGASASASSASRWRRLESAVGRFGADRSGPASGPSPPRYWRHHSCAWAAASCCLSAEVSCGAGSISIASLVSSALPADGRLVRLARDRERKGHGSSRRKGRSRARLKAAPMATERGSTERAGPNARDVTDRHFTRRQTRTSTYARRVGRCSNTWATTTTTTTGLQEGKWATSP